MPIMLLSDCRRAFGGKEKKTDANCAGLPGEG